MSRPVIEIALASTHIIRFSSGSLFAILKNTVRVRLRLDKNSVKTVYKTPVLIRFGLGSTPWFYPGVNSLVSEVRNNSFLHLG